MGDPRKIRKKFDRPSHPWQKVRIAVEKPLAKEFGLKRKSEIWRMESILKQFKDQVKSLASRIDAQSRLEEKQLIDRLVSLGLIKHGESGDAVLGLELKDILERRLQTLLVRKGLARSMNQARQFISHGHVTVDKKKITFPSYIVGLKEQALIEFVPTSALSSSDHPERTIIESAKDKAARKKSDKKEEAPPTFSEDEIKELEETGALKKKEEARIAQEAKDAQDTKDKETHDKVHDKEAHAPKHEGGKPAKQEHKKEGPVDEAHKEHNEHKEHKEHKKQEKKEEKKE